MKDYSEILARMQEKFKTAYGSEADFETTTRLKIMAEEIFSVYASLNWLKRQMFPQTAMGDILDLHAQQRDISRKKATPSYGKLEFKRESPLDYEVTIPAGTVCLAEVTLQNPNPIRIETTADATLRAGRLNVLVAAKSIENGSLANIGAKTVSAMIDPPAGVHSAGNPEKFVGGTDAEDDFSLRSRITDSYKSVQNGTNCAFYKKIAMEHDGVSSVNVIAKSRGKGTVDIYVASCGTSPGPELIQQLQLKVNELREINVDAKVLPAEPFRVRVELYIKIKGGYSFAKVKAACEQALRNHFDTLQVGQRVQENAIGGTIFNVEGVEDYHFWNDKILDTRPLPNQEPCLWLIKIVQIPADPAAKPVWKP